MSTQYDYLIVGAGLYGSIFAHEAKQAGKTCLILEKRNHIAGNIFTETQEDIQVHKYGAHIFHTNNKAVWDYVQGFAEFNRYTNSPLANYKGELYNLPFNMNTFHAMWGVKTPEEAKKIIEEQRRASYVEEPRNLEEQALNLVGKDIFEKLIKGYTEKQWGRPCSQLPAFIIRRLPVRFTYDNNYFDALYQGIPRGGYTGMIARMQEGIPLELETDFLESRNYWSKKAKHIIYTGPIDAFFEYELGILEYRSLRFDTHILDQDNFQGNAVVNYTDRETPYTRIIEHKHFEFGTQKKTVLTYEYSSEWQSGSEPYYPINDEKNSLLYEKYQECARKTENTSFGGRLGEYKYYDMDKTVEQALKKAETLLKM